MAQRIMQATVVSRGAPDSSQNSLQLALFKADGTPLVIPGKAAHQADSVAATLGALVTDFNALLAKLQAAGLMA